MQDAICAVPRQITPPDKENAFYTMELPAIFFAGRSSKCSLHEQDPWQLAILSDQTSEVQSPGGVLHRFSWQHQRPNFERLPFLYSFSAQEQHTVPHYDYYYEYPLLYASSRLLSAEGYIAVGSVAGTTPSAHTLAQPWRTKGQADVMSWSDPTDMDTLSELRPPPSSSRPPRSVSRGRSSKLSSNPMTGGASQSERRLLMEAKAGVGAAIAEVCLYIWCLERSLRVFGGRWGCGLRVARELDVEGKRVLLLMMFLLLPAA